MSTEPASPGVYHLACHCQTHVLRLTLPPPGTFTDVGVCDCSHCLKRRIVWGGAPKGSLEIIRGLGKDGADDLKEYRFGRKAAGHQFCGKCGTHVLGQKFDPEAEQLMYNLRAIRDENFDLWEIPLVKYTGIARDPPYTEATLSDLPGAKEYLEERAKDYDYPTKTYVGSCHCQAIKFAVLCEPLEEIDITDCNCSICLGNGVLWIYPGRQNTFFHPSSSSETPYEPQEGLLLGYTFGKGENAHYVCNTCGCEIFEYGTRPDEDPRPVTGLSKEEVATRQPWGPENGWNGSYGLNISLLSGIGEYLADVHGLKADGVAKEGKLKGLRRSSSMKDLEPKYALKV